MGAALDQNQIPMPGAAAHLVRSLLVLALVKAPRRLHPAVRVRGRAGAPRRRLRRVRTGRNEEIHL